MANEPQHPVRRLLLATQYSMAGFAAAWRYEQAFRLEVLCLIVAAPVGWWLGNNAIERALLIGCLLLVLPYLLDVQKVLKINMLTWIVME